jgi:hypothetical protein
MSHYHFGEVQKDNDADVMAELGKPGEPSICRAPQTAKASNCLSDVALWDQCGQESAKLARSERLL